MPRRKGSLNKRPGKQEIEGYLLMLRQAAKRGDINAAAAVVNFYAGDGAKIPTLTQQGS